MRNINDGLTITKQTIQICWNGKGKDGLPAKNGSKGSGIIALPEKDTECAFTYTVEENTLQLCFDNTYITDATYTFTVERDNLTLFGGDGTTGGTYALMRVDQQEKRHRQPFVADKQATSNYN